MLQIANLDIFAWKIFAYTSVTQQPNRVSWSQWKYFISILILIFIPLTFIYFLCGCRWTHDLYRRCIWQLQKGWKQSVATRFFLRALWKSWSSCLFVWHSFTEVVYHVCVITSFDAAGSSLSSRFLIVAIVIHPLSTSCFQKQTMAAAVMLPINCNKQCSWELRGSAAC